MPDTSCTHTIVTVTNPITGASQQVKQQSHLKTAKETGWTTCLGPMRRFVQLRSRGRIGLLPASPAP